MSATLEFRNISKVFPGVKALSDVSFSVNAGTVHGLLGENGAGKSTLLKTLGGEYRPDGGELAIDGVVQHFTSSRDSIAQGVAIIHQELQYVPDLNVMENLLLGRLPHQIGFVKKREALNWSRQQLQNIGVDIDPEAKLRHLSIGQRQMVEICKAILRNAKIIALDEPTSSLSHQETQILFRLVKDLRTRGHAMIYISHRLDEIFELCDSCTIFRDGRKVVDIDHMVDTTRDALVTHMVGREISDIYAYKPRKLGEPRLVLNGVQNKKLTKPLDLTVHAGEIVGIFGLVGAGRSELLRAIYGADESSGVIHLDGQVIQIKEVGDAIRQGLVLCPEDRKEDGIIGCRSVSENINISARRHSKRAHFFINNKAEALLADEYIQRLRIKTPNRNQPIRLLSGGNQQKAILARWLAEKPLKVLMIDEPTRGIDVGAKNEIYQVLYELAEQGVAIIMVSSELPEILGVVDRIVVMKQGYISGEFSRHEANEQNVLNLALPDGQSEQAA